MRSFITSTVVLLVLTPATWVQPVSAQTQMTSSIDRSTVIPNLQVSNVNSSGSTTAVQTTIVVTPQINSLPRSQSGQASFLGTSTVAPTVQNQTVIIVIDNPSKPLGCQISCPASFLK